MDDWVRLHNIGGDGGTAIISMSLSKILQSLGLRNFWGISLFAVLDNTDG